MTKKGRKLLFVRFGNVILTKAPNFDLRGFEY